MRETKAYDDGFQLSCLKNSGCKVCANILKKRRKTIVEDCNCTFCKSDGTKGERHYAGFGKKKTTKRRAKKRATKKVKENDKMTTETKSVAKIEQTIPKWEDVDWDNEENLPKLVRPPSGYDVAGNYDSNFKSIRALSKDKYGSPKWRTSRSHQKVGKRGIAIYERDNNMLGNFLSLREGSVVPVAQRVKV